MSAYLARLKQLEGGKNSLYAPDSEPSKPSKAPFEPFEGATQTHITKKIIDDYPALPSVFTDIHKGMNIQNSVKAELSKPSRAMGSAPDQVAINARRDAVDGEEMEVIHWLQEIEENDPEIYRDVLLAMRTNPTHRAGFLKMARGDAGGNA